MGWWGYAKRQEFSKYDRAWKHTALSKRRKLDLLQALVTSKILYSLNTAWLNKAERRRLDGFKARCLRRILHIPPAFLTRVPESKVLEQAGHMQYSAQLLQQQIILFGKIGRAPDSIFLRRVTFQPGTVRSAVAAHQRKKGRPKHEWAKYLH